MQSKPDTETQKFIDWIYQQPDDNPVSMDQSSFNQSLGIGLCGCLMVQYGKHLHPNCEYIACSFYSISYFLPILERTRLNITINELVSPYWTEIKTFKDAKHALRSNGFIPSSEMTNEQETNNTTN